MDVVAANVWLSHNFHSYKIVICLQRIMCPIFAINFLRISIKDDSKIRVYFYFSEK